MTEKKLNSITCDQCSKELAYEDNMYFGGHPLHGWFKLHQMSGSTSLHDIAKKSSWDFCSSTCLFASCQKTLQGVS